MAGKDKLEETKKYVKTNKDTNPKAKLGTKTASVQCGKGSDAETDSLVGPSLSSVSSKRFNPSLTIPDSSSAPDSAGVKPPPHVTVVRHAATSADVCACSTESGAMMSLMILHM